MFNVWNIFLRRKKVRVNRRRHPRARDCNLVRCLPSDHTPREYLANLVNLSESGLQLFSALILEPGMGLQILINLGQTGRQIPALARVVWAKKSQDSQACRAGAEFTILLEEDRLLIRHFVEACLRRAAA